MLRESLTSLQKKEKSHFLWVCLKLHRRMLNQIYLQQFQGPHNKIFWEYLQIHRSCWKSKVLIFLIFIFFFTESSKNKFLEDLFFNQFHVSGALRARKNPFYFWPFSTKVIGALRARKKTLFFDLHFWRRFWLRDIARSTRNVLLYNISRNQLLGSYLRRFDAFLSFWDREV